MSQGSAVEFSVTIWFQIAPSTNREFLTALRHLLDRGVLDAGNAVDIAVRRDHSSPTVTKAFGPARPAAALYRAMRKPFVSLIGGESPCPW